MFYWHYADNHPSLDLYALALSLFSIVTSKICDKLNMLIMRFSRFRYNPVNLTIIIYSNPARNFK